MTHKEAARLILESCNRHGLPLQGWRPDGQGGCVILVPLHYTGRSAPLAAVRVLVKRELRRAGFPKVEIDAGWLPVKEGAR